MEINVSVFWGFFLIYTVSFLDMDKESLRQDVK